MLIADWDVIVTIFNFTILAISAYLEWRKILNKSNLQYKIAMFGPESTGKTTLAIQPITIKRLVLNLQGTITENGMKINNL
jgi:septin family protein